MPRKRAAIYDEDLVKAVLGEVAARGSARLSMDAVARELRISVATLYRNYPSRRALLAAVLETFRCQLGDDADGLYNEYPEGAPFHDFWRTLAKLLVYDSNGRAFMRLYLERAWFLPSDEMDRVVPASLEWWLESNQRDLGPAPPALQARIVWGFLFALLLARGSQLERNPTLVRTLGEACWAALRLDAAAPTPECRAQ